MSSLERKAAMVHPPHIYTECPGGGVFRELPIVRHVRHHIIAHHILMQHIEALSFRHLSRSVHVVLLLCAAQLIVYQQY